jgi:hypothetical protein
VGSFDVVGELFDWRFDSRSRSWEREFPNGLIGKIELVDTPERSYRCHVMDEKKQPFFTTGRDTFSAAKEFVEHASLDD